MKLYRVLEQHFGDRQYWRGDVREMDEHDALFLLAAGLLVEEQAEPAGEKAAKPAKNKAESGAPQNKGES